MTYRCVSQLGKLSYIYVAGSTPIRAIIIVFKIIFISDIIYCVLYNIDRLSLKSYMP